MWEEYVAERWSVIPLVINSPSHKISARLGISKVPCAVRGHQGEVRAHAPWCKLPRNFPTKCVERAPTISSLAETLKWTLIKPLDLTSSAQETWGERGPRLRYRQGNSRSCPECGTFYRITSQWHQKKRGKGRCGWLLPHPSWLLCGHGGLFPSMLAGSSRVTWCSLLLCLRPSSGITGAHSATEQGNPGVTNEGWESGDKDPTFLSFRWNNSEMHATHFLRVSPAEFKPSYPQS